MPCPLIIFPDWMHAHASHTPLGGATTDQQPPPGPECVPQSGMNEKIMSEIWKTLGNEEREAYRSRARDDQKRYKAEQADKASRAGPLVFCAAHLYATEPSCHAARACLFPGLLVASPSSRIFRPNFVLL